MKKNTDGKTRVRREPNTTVPIKLETHRRLRIACARSGRRMVDVVTGAVLDQLGRGVGAKLGAGENQN